MQAERSLGEPPARGRWTITILLTLGFAIAHTTLVLHLDNTNLGTANGLWKSIDVRAWELGAGRSQDTAGLLYAPVYGWLCRWVPDSAVSYGQHGGVVTYRKMALLNALFGAVASGAVFLLAFRLVPSAAAALVIALAHATTAFVLMNSLNSEDVMPAYALFSVAAAVLMEYVLSVRWYLVAVLAGVVALIALFHWTLLPPCLAAIAAVLLLLAWRKKVPRWALIVFPLFLLGAVQAFVVAAHLRNPSSTLSAWQILFPAKAGPSGWVGFAWTKGVHALVGMGNYFSGGDNFADYATAFANPGVVRRMILSWVLLAITLGACVWAWCHRRVPDALKALAGFGGVVFLVGELEHLYSQPQDPQSQIQPMFVTVSGLVILAHGLREKLSKRVSRLVLAGCAGAFLLNGAQYVSRVHPLRGADSRGWSEVQELAGLFPPDRTVIVSHGFEQWNVWLYVEVYAGDSERYLSRNIHLASAFTNHPGVSGEQAAELMKAAIGKALAEGYQVVATSLWTQPREAFIGSLTSVVDADKDALFHDRLRGVFRTGRQFETRAGLFVELHRAGPER